MIGITVCLSTVNGTLEDVYYYQIQKCCFSKFNSQAIDREVEIIFKGSLKLYGSLRERFSARGHVFELHG
ncbi:hypothetical protein V6N12_056918 [Hibiscus sabdariffa]|uniref:Uncharacterized protein n=1 Tax=Hibiscus sabdariffa TaxID=183260 RepID=A0ABR2DCG5_9ROSI